MYLTYVDHVPSIWEGWNEFHKELKEMERLKALGLIPKDESYCQYKESISNPDKIKNHIK